MPEKIALEKLDNKELEGAMKAFKGEQSKEKLIAVMEQLENALVLQPVLPPKDMDAETLEKIKQQNGPVNSKMPPQPLVIKNQIGEQFFLVFTGKEQLPPDQKFPMMMLIPFREVAKLAANATLKLAGVVVNPFTDNLTIQMPGIMAMNQRLSQLQNQQMTPASVENSIATQIALQDIPKLFWEQKHSFMESLSHEKEKMAASLFASGFQKRNQECPFEEEEYDVMALNISESLRLIRIGVPGDKAAVGSALCVLLADNPQEDKQIYYVIQKGPRGKENLLSQIDKNGMKQELGAAPAEGEELFGIMNQIPWNN